MDSAEGKLEKNLKLFKEEYTRLQREYVELEKRYAKVAAVNGENGDVGEFSGYISRLVMTVAALYGRKTYSDIAVKLRDRTMPGHKFILSARSEEWREEILIDTNELDWSQLDTDVGDALLRWIYTDVVDLQQDSLALGLLKASHRFKLPGLMGLCERALVASVDVHSCVRFYCVAEEVGAAGLLEYCSGLISTHWEDLTAQDFQHMSGPLLYKMLKSKTKHTLHAAVRLLREDVVFLCLVENDKSMTEIINSLSPQGHLPLGLALMGRNSSIAQTLVETGGADVNAVNSEGNTLLIDAVKRADSFSAHFLLDKGCDVNMISRDIGDTALHLVCTYAKKSTDLDTYKDMLLVGKALLQHNADPNIQNNKGYTPLHLAIVSQHSDMIDILLECSLLDTNKRTADDKSALQFALIPPYTAGAPYTLAERLLEKGSDPNAVSTTTQDSLLHYLANNNHEDAAIFLVRHADVNCRSADDLSVLHIAAMNCLHKLVAELLKAGAHANAQSPSNDMNTAIHYAIEANSAEVIAAFVEYKRTAEPDRQPDFNLKNSTGDTPMAYALSLGHKELVPALINGGADVNTRNSQNLTLLHQAIVKEDTETAVFLLKHGADINALTSEKDSPLQLAIHCRLPVVVDALCCRGVSFTSSENNDDPALWTALDSEQEDIAAVLVRHGVDTNCWLPGPDGCLQTLLHRAIEEHKEATAVFLIRNGCDLDSPKQTNRVTPMHLCCQIGLARVLQALIDYGANVNALDSNNKTPLHIAIECEHDELIGILLSHPAIDLKTQDQSGNSVFATALTIRKHKAAQSILERMPNAAEQMDRRGRNFLHIAIMKDDLESVLFLLAIQVDVNSRVHDINQTPPLHLAAASKNEMITRNLILAGARINDRDATQKTALHVAAERGNLEALSALLENGADFDAVDSNGNNALHIAVRESHLTVVRELLTVSTINAEAINLKGKNPLHELCRIGQDSLAASICELFLECMPNYPINQTDIQGNTPLLLAFMRGQAPLCKVLVRNGACLGAANKEGVTIFNYKLATNQLLHKLLDQLPQESPWSTSDLCQECGTKFSITMRKHHCRHCGRMLCNRCSNNDVPILKFSINRPVRVCCVCFEVLQIGGS